MDETFDDAVIDALVVAADDEEVGFAGKLTDAGLLERRALRGHQYHAGVLLF